MSHFDPSASVSSLVSTTTEGTATPDPSTANLLPPADDGRSSKSSPTSGSASSCQPTSSRKYPTAMPKTQTYPSNSNTPPKDYEQAFASLSSAWGFGGSVPAKNPKSTKDRGDKKDKQRKKDKQKASEGVSSSSSPVPSMSSASSSG